MSDKLEYVLTPQLVERTNIRCIGTAHGYGYKYGFDEALEEADSRMLEKVRELGGTVVIDPEMTTLSVDSWMKVVMFCKVGVIDGEPSEARSE